MAVANFPEKQEDKNTYYLAARTKILARQVIFGIMPLLVFSPTIPPSQLFFYICANEFHQTNYCFISPLHFFV